MSLVPRTKRMSFLWNFVSTPGAFRTTCSVCVMDQAADNVVANGFPRSGCAGIKTCPGSS